MDKIDDSLFAIPCLRKYRLDTADNTKASYGLYKKARNTFSTHLQNTADMNFKKAAAFYGLDLSEPPVQAETPLLFKGASEGVEMNEIGTFEDLDKAVDFIIDKRASVKREELAEAAKYILWNAANSSVDLNTPKMRKIAHIAGIGVGSREKIQREFEKRALFNTFDGESREAFWKYAKELKNLSDEQFFAPKTLNTVCKVLDDMDFMYNNQYKHASDLGYPEDVIFESNIDDLCKKAEDLYYVPSIDATLSKKATLERKNAINQYFNAHFSGYSTENDEELIKKVASLDKYYADALLQILEA